MTEILARVLPMLVGCMYTVGFLRFMRFVYPCITRSEWQGNAVAHVVIILLGGGVMWGLTETDAQGSWMKIMLSVCLMLVALVLVMISHIIMRLRPDNTAKIIVTAGDITQHGNTYHVRGPIPIRIGRRFPFFDYIDFLHYRGGIHLVRSDDHEISCDEEITIRQDPDDPQRFHVVA